MTLERLVGPQPKHWILDGHDPVEADLFTWAKWFNDTEARRVALTDSEGIRVSTVFLGIDHGWGGPPAILFETMVFGGPLDQETERYATWDEAERGHAEMVERVNDALQQAQS